MFQKLTMHFLFGYKRFQGCSLTNMTWYGEKYFVCKKEGQKYTAKKQISDCNIVMKILGCKILLCQIRLFCRPGVRPKDFKSWYS